MLLLLAIIITNYTNITQYNSEKKVLDPNKHSWNRLGATLYFDSPVGTGFSYTKGNTKASDLNDERVNYLYFLCYSDFLRARNMQLLFCIF